MLLGVVILGNKFKECVVPDLSRDSFLFCPNSGGMDSSLKSLCIVTVEFSHGLKDTFLYCTFDISFKNKKKPSIQLEVDGLVVCKMYYCAFTS